MRSLLDLPPADRWAALDERLAKMPTIAAAASAIDPCEEIPVADLAVRHGLGERAMANRLRMLGGKPYQLGGKWFIRRLSLVTVLEAAENETPSKS